MSIMEQPIISDCSNTDFPVLLEQPRISNCSDLTRCCLPDTKFQQWNNPLSLTTVTLKHPKFRWNSPEFLNVVIQLFVRFQCNLIRDSQQIPALSYCHVRTLFVKKNLRNFQQNVLQTEFRFLADFNSASKVGQVTPPPPPPAIEHREIWFSAGLDSESKVEFGSVSSPSPPSSNAGRFGVFFSWIWTQHQKMAVGRQAPTRHRRLFFIRVGFKIKS